MEGIRDSRDTGFTLLWVLPRRINLQTLLDTTPPKRVPVLWDGPAPAPSKRSEVPLRAWSALCGVPVFVPSIVADTHRQGQDGSVGCFLFRLFFIRRCEAGHQSLSRDVRVSLVLR